MSQSQASQSLQSGSLGVCGAVLDRHLLQWAKALASGMEERWAWDVMQWLVSEPSLIVMCTDGPV